MFCKYMLVNKSSFYAYTSAKVNTKWQNMPNPLGSLFSVSDIVNNIENSPIEV